jgi:hypothetical protein
MILPLDESVEEMRGWEFYGEVKDDRNFCKIPVIVYTAIHRNYLPDPRDYGDVLFTMPLDVSTLQDKVRELLGSD